MRKLDREKSSPLEPVLSLRKSDMRPLPDDRQVVQEAEQEKVGEAPREGNVWA